MTEYVQQRIVTIETPYIAWALVGVALSLVMLYALFVNGAIANIVSTKDMQSQISTLTSSVASLESDYLAAQSDLTPESALALGLTESKSNALYISKGSNNSLSFNR